MTGFDSKKHIEDSKMKPKMKSKTHKNKQKSQELNQITPKPRKSTNKT